VSTFPDRVHKNLINVTRLLVGRSLVVVGAAVIAFATLTPNGGSPPPFNPLCVLCGESGAVDLVLNVLLFVPLGVGLALVEARPARAIAGMFAASLVIELLQFFVIPGRDATIRDVLMNSLGGGLGFAIGSYRNSLIRPSASLGLKLLAGWTIVWLTLQTVAAYSLMPALTQSKYYGQIGRELGEMLSAFPGEILKPTVDSVVIPDSVFPADRVRRLLSRRQGALIQATVIPRGCPTTTAGIVRIADADLREILLLAQNDADLLFGVRTGAEMLRLRPMRYRLHHVFGPNSTCGYMGDTILLQARYARTGVFLRAAARGTVTEETIAPNVSQGWRLFLPAQTYIEPGSWSATLTAMWLFILMLPAGYWGFFIAPDTQVGKARATATPAVFVLAILMIAFVGAPALFGIPKVRPWEWMAALGGAVAGATMAMRARSRLR